MKKESKKKLEEQIKKRKCARITDRNGKKQKLEILNHVTQQASELKDKVFVLDELKHWKKSVRKKDFKILRLGYYIIGKKPKARGKWVWGQFCPFIALKDLKKILRKAEKKGMI